MFEPGVFNGGVFKGPSDQLHETPFGWARIEDECTVDGYKYLTARLEKTNKLVAWSSESFKWREVNE